jgi:hypothetical protein
VTGVIKHVCSRSSYQGLLTLWQDTPHSCHTQRALQGPEQSAHSLSHKPEESTHMHSLSCTFCVNTHWLQHTTKAMPGIDLNAGPSTTPKAAAEQQHQVHHKRHFDTPQPLPQPHSMNSAAAAATFVNSPGWLQSAAALSCWWLHTVHSCLGCTDCM